VSVGWCNTYEGRKVSRVAMCEVRSKEKRSRTKQKKRKKKYSGQQQKEIDCDEPHPTPNEKTQPIQWTKRPTGALVAVNSLWPQESTLRWSHTLLLKASNSWPSPSSAP